MVLEKKQIIETTLQLRNRTKQTIKHKIKQQKNYINYVTGCVSCWYFPNGPRRCESSAATDEHHAAGKSFDHEPGPPQSN